MEHFLSSRQTWNSTADPEEMQMLAPFTDMFWRGSRGEAQLGTVPARSRQVIQKLGQVKAHFLAPLPSLCRC